ncbi:protein FAM13A [Caerostris extrusa]|uniref:Protein FAM13A n=1 Tax=Caerostris extrusa TaxID=172846 RepID=A0AAV4SB16_CAEEX|nr:protein FAM13A [Caerostris extrusa]
MLAQNQEPPGESRIDKMRKFLSSPLTRKKPSSGQHKTFGTPLEVLLQRFPSEHSVPFYCHSIVSIYSENRELPDPIIPLNMHCQFLDAVKDKDKMESIACLTELVEKLPPTNYHILSYLFSFLRKVSDMEDHNRMSASSLGIVFGPNLFRVTEDFYASNFICNTCFASDISKTSQAAAMISSWPEAKSSSAAMLSTWSLGPLCSQTQSSYDEFLTLNSLSHSMTHDDTGNFLSLKSRDHACATDQELTLVSKDIADIPHTSKELPYENHITVNSPSKCSMERKASFHWERNLA